MNSVSQRLYEIGGECKRRGFQRVLRDIGSSKVVF